MSDSSTTHARPNMKSLDDYLKVDQAPPKPPVNWTKVIVIVVAAVVILAVLGYFLVLGEQAGKGVWLQLGRNLDQREQLK